MIQKISMRERILFAGRVVRKIRKLFDPGKPEEPPGCEVRAGLRAESRFLPSEVGWRSPISFTECRTEVFNTVKAGGKSYISNGNSFLPKQ